MTKTEMKKAENHEILVDYVLTYSLLCCKINSGGGTKRLWQHVTDLEKEMLARDMLTPKDVEILRS